MKNQFEQGITVDKRLRPKGNTIEGALQTQGDSGLHLSRIQKNEKKVTLLYLGFWSFWLIFDILDGHRLQAKTYFAITTSLAAFWIGFCFPLRWLRVPRKIRPTDGWERRLRRLIFAAVVLNCLLIINLLPSIVVKGFDHRYEMFSETAILGSIWATFVVNYFLTPFTLVVIVFAACSNHARMWTSKIWAIILLALMSMTTLGRFPIYYSIYFLACWFLFRGALNFKIRHLLLPTAVAVGLFAAAWILLGRKLVDSGSNVVGVGQIAKIYVLNYHVIGFHLLDACIRQIDSGLMEPAVFPSTSLGSLAWFGHLVTKYSLVLPVVPNSFMELMDIFNGGMFVEELEWNYNAFTTCLIPFYADGGLWSIGIMHFALGVLSQSGAFLLQYEVRPQLMLICFLLTFSLFMPFVNSALPSMLPILLVCSIYIQGATGSRRGT